MSPFTITRCNGKDGSNPYEGLTVEFPPSIYTIYLCIFIRHCPSLASNDVFLFADMMSVHLSCSFISLIYLCPSIKSLSLTL